MTEQKKQEKPKEIQTKQEQTKVPEDEKTYTQKDLLLYCGITALVSGVLGYFIGENRGEKKSNEKFEVAINRWQKKIEKQKTSEVQVGKKGSDEEFVL